MLDVFLVPEGTVITAKGDSGPVDLFSKTDATLLLTLSITRVVEQESIEVSLYASADGSTWETKPLASLPQQFYVGEYPLLVDLSQKADAKFLRAHWEVNRWGRGPTTPHFEIGLRLREVRREMLEEAKSRVQNVG